MKTRSNKEIWGYTSFRLVHVLAPQPGNPRMTSAVCTSVQNIDTPTARTNQSYLLKIASFRFAFGTAGCSMLPQETKALQQRKAKRRQAKGSKTRAQDPGGCLLHPRRPNLSLNDVSVDILSIVRADFGWTIQATKVILSKNMVHPKGLPDSQRCLASGPVILFYRHPVASRSDHLLFGRRKLFQFQMSSLAP